ncbi:hypothetical protein M116_1587 [Bacteroides fragilis str. 3719 A10]|nr:hypothetical protein M116_1587 [Bacteroides fragilis str. 3719 A10]EXZ86956.1 hypothetical protein M068_4474 [Bacteroides fragilis str. J38-1]
MNVIYPVGEEIDSAFPIMVPSPDLLCSMSRQTDHKEIYTDFK